MNIAVMRTPKQKIQDYITLCDNSKNAFSLFRKYTIKPQVNRRLIHVIFSIHNFIYSAKLRFRRCQIFLRKVLNMIHFVVLTSRNCKGVELIVYIKTPT